MAKPNYNSNVISLRRDAATNSVELFSGCGGLAMGLSIAGFRHELLVEWDEHAANTVAHNRQRRAKHVRDWPYIKQDVRAVDWTQYKDKVHVVAGGPPCQPFSVGGKANGDKDARDMWPEAIRAVREIEPEFFVFENVRGLLRPAFADYVTWITAYLANPSILRKPGEEHLVHLGRLQRQANKAPYVVRILPVNAADYGAPQKRHRVLIIGVRKDRESLPELPKPTHSQDRLVWDKWISGVYWERHGLPRPSEDCIPPHEARIATKLNKHNRPPSENAWVTCRDAFVGLGEPSLRHDIPNHKFQPGARVYPGHTGSPIDEPAKALKAGVHGVPGGENMLAREDDSVRYFSIREAARLQGFDDKYQFPGSWTESMRQLGNAVPVQLASAVGTWLSKTMENRKRIQRVA
ncbi:DNA cytosine methyltransferase [Dyella sp. 2HG41-7]|uniref:DNA cytosine methyltransferase n=1 Tax=Dyella sp. 2HG41-7 TaxID=2883239 RepID=UPI001F1A4E19|nr:DNA cytosine methyltransferase [Dyella sp. 2HG41-7]